MSYDMLTLEQRMEGTPEQKIITLRSVYTKEQKLTLQPVSDGRGWYKGLERLSEEDKRKLDYYAEPTSKVIITDGYEFDLNQKQDVVDWNWVQHSPRIAKDQETALSSGTALFYVHIEEREEKITLDRNRIMHKAKTLVFNDSPSNYINRARLLGSDMKNHNPITVENFLVKMCDSLEGAKKIIEAYENPHLGIKLMYYKALDSNIITKDAHSLVKYHTTVLGMGDEGAIAYLISPSNKEILSSIEQELNIRSIDDYSVSDQPVLEVTKKSTKKEATSETE